MEPSVVMTIPMELCSSMIFFVPSSAASFMDRASGYQGVVTIRGCPSSSAPRAPGTR